MKTVTGPGGWPISGPQSSPGGASQHRGQAAACPLQEHPPATCRHLPRALKAQAPPGP